MRDPKEIVYRLKQHAANLALLLRPPPPPPGGPAGRLAGLPDPEAVARALRGSAYADEIGRLAGEILNGRYRLFGETVYLSGSPAWRRDWKTGLESGLPYYRRVDYLNPERAGDHKRVWEPARHQHLVLLAQAALLGEAAGATALIERQITGFLDANPFQRGMHWASALEVAFRALSWIWIDHLAGAQLRPEARQRLRQGLYWHGCHLEHNLSIYFSRNTHLLGEAVALHALGVLYPDWPRAERWRRTGAEILAGEIDYQVLADGADFEQSSYYHIYALDLFLFHWLLAGRPESMRPRLEAMAVYLEALTGQDGSIPLIGDDDGGRMFHPYGERTMFAQATLATCAAALDGLAVQFDPDMLPAQAAWWLGADALRVAPGRTETASRLFPDAGLVVMRSDDVQVLVDAGGFGSRRGGHSHSDSLQVLIRKGAAEILIDPGTYTYVSDREKRNWFRSSMAHNTVCVDGKNQAEIDYPFGWRSRPAVDVERWAPGETEDRLTAVCRYGEVTHRRTVIFEKPARVRVIDEIDAGPGVHTAEQFWHTGGDRRRVRAAGIVWANGWRSRCFGEIEESEYGVVTVSGEGVLRLEAEIVTG